MQMKRDFEIKMISCILHMEERADKTTETKRMNGQRSLIDEQRRKN